MIRFHVLVLFFSFFYVSQSFAAKVVFYLNFEGETHHHHEHSHKGSGFKVETVGIGNKTISLKRSFAPEETKKQFFIGIVDVPAGAYGSISLNGKSYTLSPSLSLKDNSVKAVFIKMKDENVQVFPQNILSVSKKQFFSIPSLDALGVIDEDSGFIVGFIGFPHSPYGLTVLDGKIYTGFENGQIAEVNTENGFWSGAVSIADVSLENRFLSSDRKIYIPEKGQNTICYFCPETGARFVVSTDGRIKDAFYIKKTGYLLVATENPSSVYLLSGGSGKIISTVSFPGDIVSVTGDDRFVYAADKEGKAIYRYSFNQKSIESFPVFESPLIVRSFEDFLFLASKSNLVVLNKATVSPYVVFNIRDVKEMSLSSDGRKVFVFTGKNTYYVINLDSLYVEASGDTPGLVFQAD
ncbi:PQQ-like beta-propeller repeat protein [Desulfurobacterium atlanticum]|uniref:Uncharacterized protein n=1 Tax=Desulfurobacterium atlanticum TaxID=240169 RepID=A0A238YH50_9BACT|nr:PQQ-like beta-propeller repeat protein [Desulfurobacterium atlanticum]SNR70457.1 hypothetical protein SAMN06265340_103147 [Desulfurobacterium atlanticum]